MTATLTRPAWTKDYEVELFDRLLDQYAPAVPNCPNSSALTIKEKTIRCRSNDRLRTV